MRRILKNKFFVLAILASLLVTLILTFAQIPSTKATLQNIPIGIVNSDKGTIGKKIVDKVVNDKSKTNQAQAPIFKWHKYKNIHEANQKLSLNGNYATVILPKDLSSNLENMAQTGHRTKIRIIINQGRNNNLATTIQPILINMFQKIGNGLSANLLFKTSKKNINLSSKNVNRIINPFDIKIKLIHKTKNLEVANTTFFQPVWLASLVVTLLLYFASKSFSPRHKKDVLGFKIVEVLLVMLISIVMGSFTCLYAIEILNYHFNNSFAIIVFLSIASFAFIMLFSGFISWLGAPGIMIFMLLLFFSLPLLVVAPQMLPTFYQHWVLPWLPMRFLYEGLREIIYYKGNVFNNSTQALLIISLIGIIMFFLETFNKRHKITFIK